MKINPEFQNIIPPLTAEEYAALEKSIVAEGCRDAIVTWNGFIVDGHNRYEICERHGIVYGERKQEFGSKEKALVWIINNQFARRNLTPYQYTVLALRLEEILKPEARERQVEGGKEKVSQKSVKAKIDVQKEVARIAGVSHDTVAKVKVIEKKASDKQKEKLRKNTTTVNAVYKEIKKAEAAEEKKEAIHKAAKRKSLPSDVRLLCCDLSAADIKPASIDHIVTDPPYGKEYLPLYAKLATVAERWLKDGGNLVVMIGQTQVLEILQELSHTMHYQWMFAYFLEGAPAQIQNPPINNKWKPVLWYTKGKKTSGYKMDVFKSEKPEKDLHDWGQSESGMNEIVTCFCKPGDIVCDPFMGAGTTGVVAVRNKMRFVGVEINAETFKLAESRIKNEQ